MSWFGRARFSPFQRSNQKEVTDNDFEYITKDDLKAHESSHRRHRSRSTGRPAAPQIVDWDDKNPDRDTDVLVFKHDRVSYPTHFPVQSIRDGDLKVGTVRQAAAKKLGITDPNRIRLFFKGRQLKYDDQPAREEGLRGDGSGSEILCVVGESGAGTLAPGAEDLSSRARQDDYDEGSEDDDETDAPSDSVATGKKKNRKRGKRSKKGKKAASATPSTTDLPYHNSTPGGAEFLPIPSHIGAPRPTSAPPASKPAQAGPQTAMGKLDALASKFHTELVPLCFQYLEHPPEDQAKLDYEHKKLSETILAQILLKLDSVETEGDPDARSRRKELVREVQGMLNKLDEVVK